MHTAPHAAISPGSLLTLVLSHHRIQPRRRRLRLVHGVRDLDEQLKGGGARGLVALLDAQDDLRHHLGHQLRGGRRGGQRAQGQGAGQVRVLRNGISQAGMRWD